MKRPERKLYVAPALRSKVNMECKVKTEYSKDRDAITYKNLQTNSIGKYVIPQKRSTNVVAGRVRLDSSSPDQKHTSDKYYEDDDSSDFECCCVPINEEDLNDHWENEGPYDTFSNIGNYQTNSKLSNRLSVQREEYLDTKSRSISGLDSPPNELKLNRRLFDDYDDSNSDIEAVIDSYTKRKSMLTSTPNSDVLDEKVSIAANYIPEENELKSTLFDKNNIQSTINSNGNNNDYNFQIFQDTSPVKIQSLPENLGKSFIPPLVSQHGFILPPVPRLPLTGVSPYEFVPCPVIPELKPRIITNTQHPRLLNPPSLQPYGKFPCMPYKSTSHIVLTCQQSGSNPPPDSSTVPFSIPPPHAPHEKITHPYSLPYLSQETNNPLQSAQARINPPNSVRERIKPPHPLRDRINPPNPLRERNSLPPSTHDESNATNLHQRSLQNSEFCKQDSSFYIPPPKQPAQIMGINQRSTILTSAKMRTGMPNSKKLTVTFGPTVW